MTEEQYDNAIWEMDEEEEEEKDTLWEENHDAIQSTTSNSSLADRLASNPHKGGLQDVDRAKVAHVVYEASKGSKYFLNEEKKDSALTCQIKSHLRLRRTGNRDGFDFYNKCFLISAKINEILKKRESLSESEKREAEHSVDLYIAKLEASRDMSRTIVLVDLDSFYISVETRDNPALKDVPAAVGGIGMLTTANYEARKFGVRAAMPGYIGLKLCPNLVMVPANFDKYRKASEQCQAVYKLYDPTFSMISMDEAFMDITQYLVEHPDQQPEIVVQQLRQQIFEATGGLTCSAGIACNKMLAKVCADLNKPNGQYYLPGDRKQILDFMDSLSVRKLCGVGKVSERMLLSLGINTCKDIYMHRGVIYKLWYEKAFDFLIRSALGLGSIHVISEGVRKSIGTERTFTTLSQPDALYAKLREIAEHLANDMARHHLEGRTITLKLKKTNYHVLTRARTIHRYIYTAQDIYQYSKLIMDRELPIELRLMGIKMSTLQDRQESNSMNITHFITSNTENCDPTASDLGSGILEPKKSIQIICPVCQSDIHNPYSEEKCSNQFFDQHLDMCLKITSKSHFSHDEKSLKRKSDNRIAQPQKRNVRTKSKSISSNDGANLHQFFKASSSSYIHEEKH